MSDPLIEAGKWGKRGTSYEMLDRILPVVGFRLEHSVVAARDVQPVLDEAEQRAICMTGLLS